MIDPAELGTKDTGETEASGTHPGTTGSDLFVSPQAVSKWENGESLPDIGTFPALCKRWALRPMRCWELTVKSGLKRSVPNWVSALATSEIRRNNMPL